MKVKLHILTILFCVLYIFGYSQNDCVFARMANTIVSEENLGKDNFQVLLKHDSKTTKDKRDNVVLNKFHNYTFYFMVSNASKMAPIVKFYRTKDTNEDNLIKTINDIPIQGYYSFDFSMDKKGLESTAGYYSFTIEFKEKYTGCIIVALFAKDDIEYHKKIFKKYKEKHPGKYRELLQKAKEKNKKK